MFRNLLFFFILIIPWFIYSQDKKFAIGTNLSYNYTSSFTFSLTPSVTFSSNRHFFSLGIKVFQPPYHLLKRYGFDSNYKMYVSKKSKIINPFYNVFVEYTMDKKEDSYRFFDYYDNAFHEVISPYSTKEWFFNFTAGFGFDINLPSNFYVTTCAGIGFYHLEKRYIPKPGLASSEIKKYSVSNNITLSHLLSIGVGYKFKKKDE
jgi:hypothetical protein